VPAFFEIWFMTENVPRWLVLGCHFTGQFDVNRRQVLPHNRFELVADWAQSIASQGLTAVLFHNGFCAATVAKHQGPHLRFEPAQPLPGFSPNVVRYGIYHRYLQAHAHQIDALFATDVADVVMLQNPFQQPLFVQHPAHLFCGDEPKSLHDDWMLQHGGHLRASLPGYARFEQAYAHCQLLNCGVVGGNMAVMSGFFEALWALHARYNVQNTTGFTGDMGMFNFLTRTRYGRQLQHGAPVNTVFKRYELHRADCWFRHK
jgi:hypothetical protein